MDMIWEDLSCYLSCSKWYLNSRDFFLKNLKIHMMRFLNFHQSLICLSRLGKLPHICYLLCIEFGQALLMPYERFVILFKSRSRTHHPQMYYSYTRGRRRTCLPFRPTQKCITPTLGENTKKIPYRLP
jgi:hypothetical protein